MIASIMAFLRRGIMIFGVMKICAGLMIGFGLGVYFLSILIAEKSRDSALVVASSDSVLRRGTFFWGFLESDRLYWGDCGQCRL